ncbi:cytochrome ubiquinol oxidase subunit I [Allostreptomyces psammosilenae]|uniref:Cytochrome d ubiquinol oxidase subunit I n=1 Tax=Allostreptomyces psammosilenae TaxID=1892865 RepID=A0A853A1M2_9ACTN|nr:cytochrome ubiquinol oxidase subunit I [Allostreptomyces psammosilenae]NYI07350.1 cytochrome d ubiquinol oxidase subunit I [Allostreptomyces psammosilenae]
MDPQTLDLARLQFALTAGGHFLFVALTLGLATLVACVQTWATLSRDPLGARMTRYWGQLYVINYAVGIITGLVMEFQFGLSWSGLTHFAGNVFGASLAMETLVAFFVESTFLGLWIFGWDRLNRWVHLAVIWVVTLTAYASAYWILVSNGFLNNPRGHRLAADGESLRLVDAWAVLTNPSSIAAFWHVLGGALVTAGFFVAGVSAYHLLRRTPEWLFFLRSLRLGVFVTLPALMLTVVFGGLQMGLIGEYQPMKLATFQGDAAEIARLQAEMVAEHGPGDYSPPSGWVRVSAILMVTTWPTMMMFSAASTLLASFRPVALRLQVWHVLLVLAVPLPYVAMIAGWVFREVGRQPWVVNGLLTTAEAVSPVSAGSMRVSLAVFTTVFALLALVNGWLLLRQAARGPGDVALGRPAAEGRPEPLPRPTY